LEKHNPFLSLILLPFGISISVFGAATNHRTPRGSVADMLINGNIYVKISQSNDTIFDILNSTHFCALRELNQKWLFIPAGGMMNIG